MNIDITQIVVAVIGLLGLVVTSVLVPLIRTKINAEQWDIICNYAVAAGLAGQEHHRCCENRGKIVIGK